MVEKVEQRGTVKQCLRSDFELKQPHSFAIIRFDNYYFEYFLSLATSNQFRQARSLGASAPRELLFASSGISIHTV